MNKVFVALAALAASSTANATTAISLGVPTSIGANHHVFTSGGLTVTASGFTAANAPTALYGKNGGGDEIGVGLANDPSHDNEIYYGMGYVQLDVSALFGLVSSVTFPSTNSTTDGEQWSIFGSNVSGSYAGSALLTGTNRNPPQLCRASEATDTTTSSRPARAGKNFLIAGLTATAVPEPATWAMSCSALV